MRTRLDLLVSAEAQEKLRELSQRHDGALPAVVWMTDGASNISQWTIGFYERSRIGNDDLVDASGVELVIEHHWRPALTGGAIDWSKDRFVIRARNP